jgi:hypothetical protein
MRERAERLTRDRDLEIEYADIEFASIVGQCSGEKCTEWRPTGDLVQFGGGRRRVRAVNGLGGAYRGGGLVGRHYRGFGRIGGRWEVNWRSIGRGGRKSRWCAHRVRRGGRSRGSSDVMVGVKERVPSLPIVTCIQ